MLSHSASAAHGDDIAPAPSSDSSLWSAAALTHPTTEKGWARKRLKFLVRAVAQRRRTHAWLATLRASEAAPLWQTRPRLSTKLQRPYVCAGWSVAERLEALQSHYAFLNRHFSPAAKAQIYDCGLTLVRVRHATSGRDLDVKLFYRDQFEKEGDLTLAVEDVRSGLTLAGLTFTVVQTPAGRRVVVGGLQASPGPQIRELIHDVAKEMFGLRPKAFAFWCLQELAALWSATEIHGVSDALHIYRHSHKRRDFSACYDEFWAECDGRRLPNGFWELPLRLRERTREELKPSRRKAHERRYAFFAALRPAIAQAARRLQPTSGVGAAALVDAARFEYGPNPEAAAPARSEMPAELAAPVGSSLQRTNHSY